MNKDYDLENKDDVLLDLNKPLSAEQIVAENTKPKENPRGDTIRTDLVDKSGAVGDYEPSESSKETDKFLNKFKQIRDPDSMTRFEKDVDKLGDQINEFHHEMEMDWNPAKWAYMSAWGALDVPFDVIGMIPGLGGIDDTWDSVTGFKNEGAKQFRSVASVVIPSIISGGAYAKYHAARNLKGISGAAQWVGGQMLINGAIAGVLDYGENPENRLITHPDNFARLSKAMPWMFGPKGMFPTVADLAEADSTHPYVNRLLAFTDEMILQGAGDLIGYGINAGKPLLGKIKPLSKKSKLWKTQTLMENVDEQTRNALVDLDTAIINTTDPVQKKALTLQRGKIILDAQNTGTSQAATVPAETWMKTRQQERQIFRDKRALEKIARDPMVQNFDPDIAQKLASE